MEKVMEQAWIIRRKIGSGKYDLARLGTINYGKHDWIKRGFDTVEAALAYAKANGFFVYGY